MEETTSYYYTLRDIFNKSKNSLTNWESILDGFPSIYASYFPTIRNSAYFELLDPLILRWCNEHIAILISDEDISEQLIGNTKLRIEQTLGIWTKLDNVLRTKADEYKRLKTFLDSTITNDATTTSINRSNDTPTSEGNYSEDKYTTNISRNTTTSTSSVNSLEDYDAKVSRIRNIQQEIIDEMKEFEIWI